MRWTGPGSVASQAMARAPISSAVSASRPGSRPVMITLSPAAQNRAASRASRRAVAVRLTTAGHDLIESAVRQLLDHEADLIGALSAEERAALTASLAKLERSLT